MSEGADPPEPAAPRTAGGLLRAARRAQGLHIAALAASIKVAPRKLEWLESDQFDQLPDATFTRALAQTVCRSLKIDPAPVLALLPPPLGNRLGQVAAGLNTPFHERSGRLADQDWWRVANPAWWIALLLLLAAVAIYVLPADWLALHKPAVGRHQADAGSAAGTAADANRSAPVEVGPGSSAAADAEALTPAAASSAAPEAVATGPDAARVANPIAGSALAPESKHELLAPAASALVPTLGALQLHAKTTSWVGVTDARGKSLISRVLQPNESVALDGLAPFKLMVGNAAATTVVFHGEPVKLESFTRDNVARLVLK